MALYDDASFIFLASGAAGQERKDSSKVYNLKPAPVISSTTAQDLSTYSINNVSNNSLTVSGGVATFVGDGTSTEFTSLQKNNVFENSKNYRVDITVEITTGAVKIQDGDSDENIGVATVSGKYAFYFTSGSGSDDRKLRIARRSPSAAFNFTVSDVSVSEVDVLPAEFDISRGANLTATRVGPTGLIEKGRENLFRNTVFAGAGLDTEPTGGSKFIDSTGGTFNTTSIAGQLRFITASDERAFIQSHSITTASLYSFSVFVDEVVTTLPVNRVISDSGEATDIRYEEDGVEISFSTNVQAGKRYTMVVNKTNTNSTRFRIGSGTSSQTAGDVTLSKPQLEVGIVATDYIENTSTSGSAIAGIKEDEPRFDYPLAGGAPSLLLEPERENKITVSEYYGGWQFSGNTGSVFSFTQNHDISPDGTKNASKYSATVNYRSLRNNVTLSTSTSYVFSFYVKNIDATRLRYRVHNVDGSDGSGTGTDVISSTSYYSSVSTDQWTRIEVPFTTDANGTSYAVYVADGLTVTSSGDSGGNVLFWGGQVEEGPYASSYIPTHGAAATRSGEGEAVDTFKATLPTALNGASAYTLFIDLTVTDLEEETDFRDVVVFKDSSSASTKYAFKLETFTDSGTSSLRGFVYKTAATSAVGSNAHDTIAIGSRCKLAVVVNSASGVKYFYNGSSTPIMNYSEATTYESVDSIQGAEHTVAGTRSRTRLHAIHGYPSALSDAQCISLTTL